MNKLFIGLIGILGLAAILKPALSEEAIGDVNLNDEETDTEITEAEFMENDEENEDNDEEGEEEEEDPQGGEQTTDLSLEDELERLESIAGEPIVECLHKVNNRLEEDEELIDDILIVD